MDKSTIHRAILESGTIPSVDAREIEKISAQYPFFNTAQVLLSKVYQKAGDHRFIDQLNQAAMYSIDRKILHRYLHTSIPAEDKIEDVSLRVATLPAEIETENIVPAAEEIIRPSFEKALESKTDDISDIGINAPEELTEKILSGEKTSEQEIDELVNSILEGEIAEQPVVISSAELSEKMAEESLSRTIPTLDQSPGSFQANTPSMDAEIVSGEDKEPQSSEQTTAQEVDELDKEILLEALRSSIELEVSETETEEFSGEEPATASDFYEEITEEITQEPEKAEDSPNTSGEKVQTYADWIYRRSQQIHFSDDSHKPLENENAVPDMAADWLREETFSEKVEEKITPSGPEITPIPDAEEKEQTTLSHGVTKIDKPDKKTHQRDLVDRFIKKEPRITPGKSVDYLPGNLFKDSLEEDYEFMTETIAQLLARQGKFDKARKAYRKLIEQHPEKSVYFAAQLKNLDRLKKP